MPHQLRLLSALFYLSFLSLTLTLSSCTGEENADVPLNEIDIEWDISRLDQKMLAAAESLSNSSNPDSLQLFREIFAEDREFLRDWFFMGNDSLATDENMSLIMFDLLSDPNFVTLLEEVRDAFPQNTNSAWEQDLQNYFKRFHYHFPDQNIPQVVTFADGYPRSIQQGIDNVLFLPQHLGLGLHYFLGEAFPYYPKDLPRYLSRRFNPQHLPAIVAHEHADRFIPAPDFRSNPRLVDHLVHQGLQTEFVHELLGPGIPDSTLLFYTDSQLAWAQSFEAKAYRDLVPQLYDLDAELIRRFIDDSPFTGSLNRKSAPRLGQYLGWQIIKEYRKKYPEVTLSELVRRSDYEAIFREAGYRPEA